MSDLASRLQQTRAFESPAQEALLSLLVASATVREEVEQACGEHGLSSSQYNVLRILAGGPKEGYARCDIIDRMIDRQPDVTRLMDRLEDGGYVERGRSERDRRLTMHCITRAGRALLARMHADVKAVGTERFAQRLSEEEQRELARLCTAVFVSEEQ